MLPCETAGPRKARLRTSTRKPNIKTRLCQLRGSTFWFLLCALYRLGTWFTKKTRLHRRTPSGFIRHYFAIAQVIHPRTDLIFSSR